MSTISLRVGIFDQIFGYSYGIFIGSAIFTLMWNLQPPVSLAPLRLGFFLLNFPYSLHVAVVMNMNKMFLESAMAFCFIQILTRHAHV